MSSEPILLTVPEVQALTQLGRTKVYELIGAGKLPIIRIGRSVRIRREAGIRNFNRRPPESTPPPSPAQPPRTTPRTTPRPPSPPPSARFAAPLRPSRDALPASNA